MRLFRVAAWVGLCITSLPLNAHGLPGTHSPAISTFDTRGSTVVLAYREGFADTTFRVVSYNANFSATGGNFSAQFGAHYVQFRDVPGVALAHGAGASGVGLFSIPVASRYDNGVPKAALDLYLGATPTVAVSGARNFLTAPLVLGFGVSGAPASWLTLTPWFEAAPSVNWDTFINPNGITVSQQVDVSADGEVQFDSPDVQAALREAIDSRLSFHVGMRAGLLATMHLGENWDFNLSGDATSLGSAFGGQLIVQAGAALVFHWDDIVPAVLPARRRLSKESCEAISERFMSCPQYRELLQRSPATLTPVPRPAPPASTAPASPSPASPPSPSATPPAPVPDEQPKAPPGTTFEPIAPPGGPPQGSFPPPP